jgi:DNA polymerase V
MLEEKNVFFIGCVYAGFPSPAADYVEEDIDLKRYLQPNTTSIYLARVRGHSMMNAHIPDNSIIVIDKSRRVNNNSVVVASLNGEKVLKHFVKTHSGIFLSPNNSNYKPIKITDGMDFAVWGVVTHVIIELSK